MITDPTEYHRLRIREALGFGDEIGSLGLLDALDQNLRTRPGMEASLKGIALLRQRLLIVRNLCADGDGVP